MKNWIFLMMASVISIFLLGSCTPDSNSESGSVPGATATIVDMTVVVPFHPSSLEYFDYVIHYYDNNGLVHVDTIRKENGGLVVEDTQSIAPESNGISCSSETFNYKNLPAICTVTVKMIPNKDSGSVGQFIFCSPKPYIFPSVHNSSIPPTNEEASHIAESVETILINPMSVESFQKIYGETYSSYGSVTGTFENYQYEYY